MNTKCNAATETRLKVGTVSLIRGRCSWMNKTMITTPEIWTLTEDPRVQIGAYDPVAESTLLEFVDWRITVRPERPKESTFDRNAPPHFFGVII
jgi:hypothetical protein